MSPASTMPPAPLGAGSVAELAEFERLQRLLLDRWTQSHAEVGARDIVVIPSLSLERLPMESISGITHYEERMLFTMMLLRHPRAHLVYVTSTPVHPAMVDYVIGLVRGFSASHVRSRLTLLSTHDSSPRPLTEKILERPRLIGRIRRAIRPENAHMTVFTVSHLERSLCVRLGIPLYGVDPKLLVHGTKSGSRKLFRRAGVAVPKGMEDIRSCEQVVESVAELWEDDPALKRVVVKHDHGVSGQGNAVLNLTPLSDVAPGKADRDSRSERIEQALEGLEFGSSTETWTSFRDALETLGGTVEAFVEGERKRAPSGQLRINPRRELECVSTHDQRIGGPHGQTYEGCKFPADLVYWSRIQNDALRVGEELVREGVIGRVAVDFIATEEAGSWKTYAIEINLRMGGTTHPLMLMKLLSDGRYDAATGMCTTARGEPRYYEATDSLYSPHYRGLLVEDLFDIAAVNELHYRPWTDTGVVFHLTGALSQHGKLGITAIGTSPEDAALWFQRTREVLDRETQR